MQSYASLLRENHILCNDKLSSVGKIQYLRLIMQKLVVNPMGQGILWEQNLRVGWGVCFKEYFKIWLQNCGYVIKETQTDWDSACCVNRQAVAWLWMEHLSGKRRAELSSTFTTSFSPLKGLAISSLTLPLWVGIFGFSPLCCPGFSRGKVIIPNSLLDENRSSFAFLEMAGKMLWLDFYNF